MSENAMDTAAALDRLGGDARLLAEIAGLFISEYPKLLADVRDALAAADAHRLERAAHALKGSVANFSAAGAVGAAFAVEKLGRLGELEDAPAALERLENELARLHPVLESLAHQGR